VRRRGVQFGVQFEKKFKTYRQFFVNNVTKFFSARESWWRQSLDTKLGQAESPKN
jgi:hypothetical protein